MKILAIRGKNLASLTHEFCVDFQCEPLASAGLYAISGPTGAGKSTLLDALCLALYENTPRLTRALNKGEIIPDVGDNSVGPSDPRTILRRGAADGFAEVDFVGSDGVPYRARWSVRRARNNPDGKLQPSEITLVRLSDMQSLGEHRKTDTLKLIERCIGLSFEQFTRAVLLAQNDFAAFLKASDDDRAELLQTLTGTETFTHISKQAFARAKRENEELNRLKLQLADQQPLAPDIRAAKLAERAAQDAKVQGIEQQHATIEGRLRWHRQWDTLKGNESDAITKRDLATLAKDGAAERCAHLARVEAVQGARPLCVEVDRLARETGNGATAVKDKALQLHTAAALAKEHAEQCDAAVRRLQVLTQSRDEAQPRIDQAKALDAAIAALTPNCRAAVIARDESRQTLEKEQARLGKLQQDLAQSRDTQDAGERWLAQQAHVRPLAEGWLRWDTLLSQACAHLRERDESGKRAAELAKADADLHAALELAGTEHAARIAEHKAASEALAVLAKACAAFQPDAMAVRKQALDTRRDCLVSAAQSWHALGEQQQRRQQLESDRQALAATLARCDAELLQCAAGRPFAERDVSNAEKSLRIAELATSKDVVQMRGMLDADSPCPVCGSLTHPYAEHNPQLDGVLGALRDEVARTRTALTMLLEEAAAAHKLKQGEQKRLDQNAVDLASANTMLLSSQQRWATHPLAEEIGTVPDADRTAWLAAQQAGVKAELAQLGQEETRYREAVRQRDAAQEMATKALPAMDLAKAALTRLALDHQKTAQARQTTAEKMAGIERLLSGVQTTLDAAFPNARWREDWLTDPQAFHVRCKSDAEAWQARQKQMLDLAQQIGTLTATIKGAADMLSNAAGHLKTQADQCAALEQDLQARQRDRTLLFDGRPLGEVEDGFNAAIEKAKSGLAQRQTDIQKADADRLRLDEAVRQMRVHLETNQQALASATRQRDEWLQALNARSGMTCLALEELNELLAFQAEWIGAERRSLQDLDTAIRTAQAVVQEHQGARMAHEAGKPGEDETAEMLNETISSLHAELEAAKQHAATLRVDLARDDERLQKSQSLMSNIEKQGITARVWSQLGELIGSADGKKFRNFAQQLTLDILLGYANRHLESLSRRYRLERIKDSLGLLVVDQDMGNEVRSVHSLSGGESFLVSLALALGLASLSSHRVRVESLFIDEGFGSLDADSLGVAMEALDNIQAQGRKVGVISHVQEMTERIGVRIQVNRLSGGQSRVFVAG